MPKKKLALFKADAEDFLARLYHIWLFVSPLPTRKKRTIKAVGACIISWSKKAMFTLSDGKMIAFLFGVSEVMSDFLEWLYNHRNVSENKSENSPGTLTRGISFYNDNAQKTIYDCGLQLLPHPLYSPDRAASDFYLFSGLKKSLSWQTFSQRQWRL